jgi:3',5'-cyclic-AMP phosphodiesterase
MYTVPSSAATASQVWFELDANAPHLASHEPPAYGVVLIDDENLVVHSHDFLDEGLRFPFEPPVGTDGRDYALNFPAR